MEPRTVGYVWVEPRLVGRGWVGGWSLEQLAVWSLGWLNMGGRVGPNSWLWMGEWGLGWLAVASACLLWVGGWVGGWVEPRLW